MVHIYLTRHGQDLDNLAGILNGHRDRPLSDLGRTQAHELGSRIRQAGIVFDAIYSSPLARAFETAQIISGEIGGPIPEKENLLIERDFGTMTGKNVSDIKALCSPDIVSGDTVTYFLHPKEGETFPDMMNRARILLDTMISRHRSGNILLVCHGDIGKIIYAQYYKQDWKSVLTQFHFGNCDLLLLSKDTSPNDSRVFQSAQHNH